MPTPNTIGQMTDDYNPAILHVEMPSRIRALPIHPDFRMPVPWFVGRPAGRPPDLRTMDRQKLVAAVNLKRCWICGGPLGRYMAFMLGPMCVITRTVSEPPSHRDCAVYAVRVCPFLVNPDKHRRERGMPEGVTPMAGIPILGNPGAIAVWITRSYKPFEAPKTEQSGGGVLFSVGDAVAVKWFREGRHATHEEVLESIEAGLPKLLEIARQDPHPDAVQCLRKDHAAALRYVPE